MVGLARAGVNGVGNKLLAFAKNLKSRLDAVLHEPCARRLRPALLLGSADEEELRRLADSHGGGGQGRNKRDGQLVERTGKIGVALDVGVHGANGVVAHAAENAHTLFWDVLRALLFGERMILPALTKTSLRAGDDLTDLVAHVDELGALNANGVRHSPSSLRAARSASTCARRMWYARTKRSAAGLRNKRVSPLRRLRKCKYRVAREMPLRRRISSFEIPDASR